MSNSLNSLIIKSENLDGSLKILDFRSASVYRGSLIESYWGIRIVEKNDKLESSK